jgi:hypothetical protein
MGTDSKADNTKKNLKSKKVSIHNLVDKSVMCDVNTLFIFCQDLF